VTWTDERLDDLNRNVEALRDDLNRNVEALREEIKALRVEMQVEFRAINARFDSMQRSMLWMMGTMLVVVASILASAKL